MPSFLKDLGLRRRSKASITTADTNHSEANNTSSNASSNEGANDDTPQNKSTSTLSSFFDRNSPPTTLSSQKSKSSTHLPMLNGKANGSKTPPLPGGRPRMPSSNSNRFSIVASSSQCFPRYGPTKSLIQGMPQQNGNGGPRSAPASSPLAPIVDSISDGSWVNQKVLLVYGKVGDGSAPLDGTITIVHDKATFPPTSFPVNESHFKALVYLQPGPNRLRLDFFSPKLPPNESSIPAHSSWLMINYLPLTNTPPLQLVILVAKDSPETFDAVPERKQREGNNLAVAIRKFRMAAYLWQAFTGEQMNRNGFGRRNFRYEEEWQPGTASVRDLETGQMRNEAKIHVVKVDKTVREIRDLDLAQQNKKAKKSGDLFSIAMETVKNHFGTRPGQKQYVSCMYLDTTWDRKADTVRGHAALGGGDEALGLAIFGSHSLQSYPSHIEEVVPAFTDCTLTDTNFVANDCNESGSNWEAANIGIGAHMHETGHLLGCPHQESGVMLRDYVRLNRTFCCNEPYSTRTREKGRNYFEPEDECAWHRLDTLRFRFHPCFQTPQDQPLNGEKGVQVWTVDNNTVLVTAATGVAWIELYPEGDDVCHHWIEYLQDNSPVPALRQVTLSEQDLRARLPEEKRKRKLKIKVFSCGGGEHEVADFSQIASKSAIIKLPDGRPGFRSSKLGFSQMEGSRPQDLVFASSYQQNVLMTSVKAYAGDCLDGVEFFYESGESQLFGKRGGRPGGFDFPLNTRKGEIVIGFNLRAGLWIDGIQVLTSLGRRSEMFGNVNGGSGHTLIPPRGYSIAGVYGSCGQWLDGFGVIISR